MQNLYIGDFLYFERDGVEILGEVIGINVDRVITLQYKSDDGIWKTEPIGDHHRIKFSDIRGIKELDIKHGQKEKHAYLDSNGHWRFTIN